MRASPTATVRLNLQTLEDRTVPNGGRLDPSFGDHGVVIQQLNDSSGAMDVLIQPDGKIVVAGRQGVANPIDWANNFIARFNSDGSLDPTFGGGDGFVSVTLPGVVLGEFWSIAREPDGKLVATGASIVEPDGIVMVARVTADGTPDPTFGGGDGVVMLDLGQDDEQSWAVACQPDGKIVVAGYYQLPPESSTTDFLAIRLLDDGSFDPTFGDGDGIATIHFGSNSAAAEAIAIRPDGSIVLAGYSNLHTPDGSFALAQLSPDGNLDTSFGDKGITMAVPAGTSFQEIRDICLLDDGRILAVGETDLPHVDGRLAVLRFNATGALDTSFGGGDGAVLGLPSPCTESQGYALSVQADGRFVVAGVGNGDSMVARFNPNGTLDPTFNPPATAPMPGVVLTDNNSPYYNAYDAVAIQPDGKIIAAGAGWDGKIGPSSDASVARYYLEDPPMVAADDAFSLDEDVPLTVDPPGVRGNDDIPGFYNAAAVLVQGPAHAAAFALRPDGSFVYTPTPDYNGADAFRYRLVDGRTSSNTATVHLTIAAVDDPPRTAADAYVVPAVGPLTVPAAQGVLANDREADGQALTATLTDPPPTGTLFLSTDGSFTYDFAEDFFGSVTFTYTAGDGTTTSPPTPVMLHRGSTASVSGATLAIVGSPGVDVVHLFLAFEGAIRVEMQTPDGVTRATLKPPAGTRRFKLVDVYLADGNDRLDALGLNVPVRAVGGAGNDYLRTGVAGDVVFSDQVDGSGTGDDMIETGPGDDNIVAGNGRDMINAGLGNDTVTAGTDGSFVDAGGGKDFVTAAGGANWFIGGAGRDVLVGGDGNDLLDGGLGNDLIVGGLGADTAEGGAGYDLLFDGQVAVNNPATDSLVKVLASYVPSQRSSLVGITNRITVTFDPAAADNLLGRLGVDWFWTNDSLDQTDRRPAEPLNAVN